MSHFSLQHVWDEALGRLAPVFIEIGRTSLKVVDGDRGLELSLEREGSSLLTAQCRDRVTRELNAFLKGSSWYRRRKALCAVAARGVSVRHLSIPPTGKDDLERVLAFQIEKEFPLPPEQLAWGYQQPASDTAVPGSDANQQFVVIALKKDRLTDYAELFNGCGLKPIFTLGANARSLFCPENRGAYAILDVGRSDSELIVLENGTVQTLRTFSWGVDTLAHSLGLVSDADSGGPPPERTDTENNLPPHRSDAAHASPTRFDSLAASIAGSWSASKLYLTGEATGLDGVASRLSEALGRGIHCEVIEAPPGDGSSAATHGLKRYWEFNGDKALPVLSAIRGDGQAVSATRTDLVRWTAVVLALVIALVAVRYIEAIVQTPALEQRLAQVNQERVQLPEIEHKIAFLQHLQTNRPPYVGVITLLSRSAPKGTFIESLSMNGSGQLSLRAKMERREHAVHFRKQLNDSAFFSRVVVEEQAPSSGKKKIGVRMSALWNPSSSRPPLSDSQPNQDEKPKTPSDSPKGPRKSGSPGEMPRNAAATRGPVRSADENG